jgi:Na+/H+ antiporter NhaB
MASYIGVSPPEQTGIENDTNLRVMVLLLFLVVTIITVKSSDIFQQTLY